MALHERRTTFFPWSHGAAQRAQRGQSMLEAIIASGIIVTAVASALTLVTSSIQASKESETSITATNLAREGVEVVRNMRDSNWLADKPFDTGLSSGTDYAGILVFTPATGAWAMDYAAADNATDAAARVYRHDGTAPGATLGLMTQAAVQPASTSASPYGRIVLTEPICEDAVGVITTVSSGADCGAKTKVGIRVLSRVYWTLGGRPRKIESEERMYDWR
ncbi:MAG: hypothetical protein RLZZ324_232 [Candidatus Parcubacteria bacterium]|jgi:Tfp pilus assembly protein PilV